VKSWIEEKEKGLNTIMGSDFNARTGETGAGMEGGRGGEVEEEKKVERQENEQGQAASRFFREKGMGNLKRKQEEYTFTGGAGNTVIDYVMGDEEVRKKVWNMRMEDKIDSDHHLLVVVLKGEKRNGKREMEKTRLKGRYGIRKGKRHSGKR